MDETARQSFRRALGAYATGVVVVTALRADGAARGITVNSFASLSLDPPLVLWSLGAGSARYETFATAALWGVTVLGADGEDVARRMAKRESENLGSDEIEMLENAPVLKAAVLKTTGLAHFACRTHVRHKLGDHLLIVGEVLGYRAAAGAALTFYRGAYRALADGE